MFSAYMNQEFHGSITDEVRIYHVYYAKLTMMYWKTMTFW